MSKPDWGLNHWKVITGPTGHNTQVFIDGRPVHGIRRVKVDFGFRDDVRLELELVAGNLEIEGLAGEKGIVINRIDIEDLKAAQEPAA